MLNVAFDALLVCLKQGHDRGRVVDTPDGLPQEIGHRQHSQLREEALMRDRNSVGDNDLLKDSRAQALDGRRREDGVRRAGVHLPRALRMQHLCCIRDGACSGTALSSALLASSKVQVQGQWTQEG